MKIMIICGDNLRHKHFANQIIKNFEVTGIVANRREMFPESGNFLNRKDKELFEEHFELRSGKEKEFFEKTGAEFLGNDFLNVTKETLNSKKTMEFVKNAGPDIVITYGSGLLKKELLNACPEYTINFHGGLSPWYRGTATLLYPVYFMEPQFCGTTLHFIDRNIDSGKIIQHSRPEIKKGDSVHDIGCRAVVKGTEDTLKILKKIENGEKIESMAQKIAGKVFYDRDFQPHHLRVIKMLLQNGFLQEFLENREKFSEPEIFSQI